MIQIKIRTLFDITATGVTGHFKSARIPFQDQAGNRITDINSWNRSRNQQRNYETLIQLISLRTQIFDLTLPVEDNNTWQFDFCVETPGIFGEADNFSVLANDAEGIPMLRELDNSADIDPVLITSGPSQNIWFEANPINITLEN